MLPVPQLIALAASVSFAVCFLLARHGLSYSTPITVTCVGLIVQAVTLGFVVLLTGGIPRVAPLAFLLFVIVGVLMAIVRLLSFTGVSRIGAARASSLRSTFPLFSVLIAITILGEEADAVVLSGTLFVVGGIILISWQAAPGASSFRWLHVLTPLLAAFLAGVVHPIRRYALELSNFPVFFAALVGFVSLITLVGYLALTGSARGSTHKLTWNSKAVGPFLGAGLFQTLGFLLINYALSLGPVVLVIPIVAAFPIWVLFGTMLLLRHIERVSVRTIAGTCLVVAGTVAITLGG